MTILGFRCKRGYRTLNECEVCPVRCILIPVVRDLKKKQGMDADGGTDDGYFHFKDNEYHVTSLLGCPRKAVLGRLCGDYAVPVNVWKMQLGTLGHDFMEKTQTRGITERLVSYRFYIGGSEPDKIVSPDGLKTIRCNVVGRFDWLDTDNHEIHDYKFVWSPDYLPHEGHFRQIATYHYIGIKCGVFTESSIVGGEIDYVDVTTGIMHPYRVEGDRFIAYRKEMELYVPKMLGHYVDGIYNNILPKGDPKRDECNYCNPEFKAYCKEGKNCNCKIPDKSLADANAVKVSIDAYRKENTPADKEE